MLKRLILSIIVAFNPFSGLKKNVRKRLRPFRIIHRQFSHKYLIKSRFPDTIKQKALGAVEIKAKIPHLPKAQTIHVIDGDTVIVLKNGNKLTIRLDSIDCPEDGQDWGDIATYGLIKLIGRKIIHLEEHGLDNYGRTLATLYVWRQDKNEWLNVNERMVTLGHAWVMRIFYDHLPKERQNKLNRLERWAKSKKVGLWQATAPIPPWKWRNRG